MSPNLPNVLESHLIINSLELDAASLLAADTELSKQQIKQAMNKGAVWLTRGKQTQRLRRAKRALKLGDELHLYYNHQVLAHKVDAAELIFDGGQYSIWYKPYGMLCQGSKWGDHTTINRYAETHLSPDRPAFIIHRLDRAATGLVLIGHSKKTTAALAKLFELRLLDKYYQVIVEGQFNLGQQESVTIGTDVDGKAACSHAKLLQYDAERGRSLVQVKIESGRKHQIRIHMESIGYPVVGDRLHGVAKEDELNLQLTSCYLKFTCPITDEIKEFELPQRLRPKLSAC
ncbi:RluA family pseudouridine synthase [Shewanella violacea]|uniref:Ribosomal large subunit pseudouridine synthase family protein n=1 Tax=Shewanella violacea (strain JCM 10179 / CIP 106290 / LMG 19151 / DSS12) TaxID=637905 RepID=D4ZAG5_SHEVD|nr:RluA family pseudouridine synthase [Shewanella violacea]BAJ03010.1 ribosomal large subunit pseudouridine synthase family protein [Shewanella violacea DSS12]